MKYIKKMLAGTLSVLVALFCALPPAYAGPEVNTATANSTAPSFETNTDYVIRNMETGLFLRCSGDKLVQHRAYFGSIGETDYEYYLWQFNPLMGGGCYTLYNKGKKGNLTDDATSSTYRGKTDGTGATWYVTPNLYNESGYLISSSQDVATNPTNCLYAYKAADKSYYLCSTENESVDLEEHEYGTKHYYQLPTFQFYTYDQLFALAQKCGYTGTKATGTPTQQNWADLVDQINASLVLSDQNTVSSNETPVHNFVIASRRYRKFLNIDNDGNLHVADKITTSSIFQQRLLQHPTELSTAFITATKKPSHYIMPITAIRMTSGSRTAMDSIYVSTMRAM